MNLEDIEILLAKAKTRSVMIRASSIGTTYYLDVRVNGVFIARTRGPSKNLVKHEAYALVKAWSDAWAQGTDKMETLLQASVEAKRHGNV